MSTEVAFCGQYDTSARQYGQVIWRDPQVDGRLLIGTTIRWSASFGDDRRKSMDRVWDIVLTKRLGELGYPLIYGLAVDDAHHFKDRRMSYQGPPGRGWIMVRSQFLTPEHIVKAIERGDFYGTTGVELRHIHVDEEAYTVEIEPEDDVTYRIQFIGTRQGYDASSEPVLDENDQPIDEVTRRYSDEIGQVLNQVEAGQASYTFTGEELYVRVRIISSNKLENPHAHGEHQKAWLQPAVP